MGVGSNGGGVPNLDLSFLSFFFRFGTFPIFSGFSRFVWGLFGDLPDLSFSSFLGLLTAPMRNSPERVCVTICTFPDEKWETPRFSLFPKTFFFANRPSRKWSTVRKGRKSREFQCKSERRRDSRKSGQVLQR